MLLPWQPSDAAKVIAELMLRDPYRWVIDSYEARHAGTNIGVWTGNGVSGVHFWLGNRPPRSYLRAADRHHIWRAFVQMRRDPTTIINAVDNALITKDQTK